MLTPVRFSRPVEAPLYGEGPITVSVEIDPSDDGALIRGIESLNRAAGSFKNRCPGCLVPYSEPSKVHTPACPLAPADLIESCREEMEYELERRGHPF